MEAYTVSIRLSLQDAKKKDVKLTFFKQLSAYDEILNHGKLSLTVRMTRYLVMAGSHHVVLDRCGILILWE